MRKSFIPLLVVALLTTTIWISAAYAVDLTGTWLGQQSCKNFGGASLSYKLKPSVMLVTQTGHSMIVRVDGVNGYNGFAIDDAKKPDDKGQVSFVRCGTDEMAGSPNGGELLVAKVKAKPGKVLASLIGSSGFQSSATVGNCKWSYKRTDTADPAALACP